MSDSGHEAIPAISVSQWLPSWNQIEWDETRLQGEPSKKFYVFSMSAAELRRLSGVHRRDVTDVRRGADDPNTQRAHKEERSLEIRRYVDEGYPLSDMPTRNLLEGEKRHLRRPGWLPTAVVVNLLRPGDVRSGATATDESVVEVDDVGSTATLRVPATIPPTAPLPMEVIDGQHRLLAFSEDDSEAKEFFLPVVAFHGLDRAWQAYLFWTINIRPKRINASLAYDLYPLLRDQDWLAQSEHAAVYRDTRAQELTELLWSYPGNPWHKRINMLGDTGAGKAPVSQAAFIRSLVATYVKSWRAGGLFGADPFGDGGLGWDRSMQAALLVALWSEIHDAVAESDFDWAEAVRSASVETDPLELEVGSVDAAFAHRTSLLSTDQGVRAVLAVSNELLRGAEGRLEMEGLRRTEPEPREPDLGSIAGDVAVILDSGLAAHLTTLARALAGFDWRTSAARGLNPDEVRRRQAYRGSSGYKVLRDEVMAHLAASAGVVAAFPEAFPPLGALATS